METAASLTEASKRTTEDKRAPLTGILVDEPLRKLRVCVLHPSSEGTAGPFTADVDEDCQPELYDPEGRFEWANVFLKKASSAADLVRVVNSGLHDVFLNLCDGAWDEDRAGKEVIEALEKLNVPYTGADAAFYEPSKMDMKKAAYLYGIKVPAWVYVQGGPGQEEAGVREVLAAVQGRALAFPLIVKHPSGYGSVGMTRRSKVTNEEELREQVSYFVREYGSALVEQFIAGREFTVFVVEEPRGGLMQAPDLDSEPSLSDLVPRAYPPAECVFGKGEEFKHFDIKWKDYEAMSWQPCGDEDLRARLQAAAGDAFLATRGVSYGRSDFRVEAGTGDIYFLEINPNCGVLLPPNQQGSADFILSLDPACSHRTFMDSIFAAALHRHRCRQTAVAPAFIRLRLPPAAAEAAAAAPPASPAASGGGVKLGLVALRPIRAGRVVQRREQRPLTVASLGWVERNWPPGGRDRTWFNSFAFPLSDQVWVTPPADYTQWSPLTHCCDPNSAVRGLDLVARRDIAQGEEITVDLATVYGPRLEPFNCSCAAANCRGRVAAEDYLLPYIGEVYGDALISPYVAEARRRNLSAATDP